MVVPEIGLWLALLTLLFGVGAWLLRRGHPLQTGVTLILCSVAIARPSAGGQMAAATAYWKHDPTIRGVIAIYPPTDFRRAWEVAMQPGNIDHRLNLVWYLGGNPENASSAFDSASGALLVNSDAPPTLILQGELDVNVFHEQSALLEKRLSDARVPHPLASLPWAAQAFDLVGFNTPGG